MIDDLSNENNLVQRREDKRTLAKMRSKLATSGQVARKLDVPVPKQKKGVRIWPFVVGLGLMLAGMNFAVRTQHDRNASLALGGKSSVMLAPPAGATLDERARFWCYATYDYDKLKLRFKLPKGAVLDKAETRRNLDKLLAEDLGSEVRTEIFAYQQAHPDPIPKAPVKPVKKK